MDSPYAGYGQPGELTPEELLMRLNALQGRIASTISEVERVEGSLIEKESQILQTIDNIQLRVTANEEGIADAESTITLLSDEIDLRVTYNDVISAINLSPEGVYIQGSKINLVGSVTVLSDITGDLGDITAGVINGVEMNSIVVNSGTFDAGNAGVTSSGTTRMWAGATFAGRGSAPFRVNSDGQVITSDLLVTGGDIYGVNISISEDVEIGRNLVLGNGWSSGTTNSIYFNGTISSTTTRIYGSGDDIYVQSGLGTVTLDGSSVDLESTSPIRALISSTDGLQVKNQFDTAFRPVSASDFITGSSRDIKKNIEAFNMEVTPMIESTTPRLYHYLDDLDSEFKRLGFMLDEVPPELIDLKGKGVITYAMTVYLWKGVQELIKRIKVLEGSANGTS